VLWTSVFVSGPRPRFTILKVCVRLLKCVNAETIIVESFYGFKIKYDSIYMT
jgi:hypothetical protein